VSGNNFGWKCKDGYHRAANTEACEKPEGDHCLEARGCCEYHREKTIERHRCEEHRSSTSPICDLSEDETADQHARKDGARDRSFHPVGNLRVHCGQHVSQTHHLQNFPSVLAPQNTSRAWVEASCS